MKKTIHVWLLIVCYAFLLACSSTNNQEKSTENTTQEAEVMNKKLLRHLVIFKFKEESSEEAVKEIENAFQALPKAIKEIKAFEWGMNISSENLDEGFTHCFMLSFASEDDLLNTYLPHPAHQAFVASLGEQLEKAFVVDYWAGE